LIDGTPIGGAQYQFFINHATLGKIASNLVGNVGDCDNTSVSSYINTEDLVCNQKWHFVTITYDGVTHKMFINGVLRTQATTSFNAMKACNSDIRIGNWWQADLLYFKGDFDDMRWYNRALNIDEIKALYGDFQLPGNDWLHLPSATSYATVGDLDITGNQVTVEALVNRVPPLNTGNPYGYLVSKHSTPADANYALQLNGCALTTTNGYTSISANCQPELNKIYHVAMVYDGAMLKFYRNGFLVKETPATGNMINNNLLATIGQIADPIAYLKQSNVGICK
jgi:hypothetical protein